MSELYLIAHKVRGEPAFDVAIQMDCPLCMDEAGCNFGCAECDNAGYWWIIPTSGHRAYPWWSKTIAHVSREATFCYCEPGEDPFAMIDPMPDDAIDHYITRNEPRQTIDLSALMKPSTPIRRRV